MGRPSNADKLAALHKSALDEFDAIQKALKHERGMCLEDRRFYSIHGASWEGALGEQFENRPRLEFNRVHLAVIRIISEYRNNRITVDFTPKDGSTNADLADTCDGLYRADEQDSGAQEAYDNAFEEAVGGGIGAWRLCAKYEDEEDDENEQQRIAIEPIFDADSSVWFDLDAKRQDKADARRCWVISGMTPESFKTQFGHDPATWPKDIEQRAFDWWTPDTVYVAEFYEVEETHDVVRVFRGLDGTDMNVPQHELDEDPEKLSVLLATGFREVRQKKMTRKRVHKYILSGSGVEKDDGYIPGSCIPVVVTYGKRWYVDNVERCMGHVRLAKDAQRLQNSLLSWLTEIASRFDTEKPILTPEQIAGHAQMWADDNVTRFPYLLINPMTDPTTGQLLPSGPIGYTRAPSVPPAMAALIQIATQALEDLLGNQQAGEQLQPNQSGKAVELIQQRLDMQTFIYMSNFAKAMKRSGEIWLSMARDLLIENGRQMKTVTPDGAVDTVTLRQPMVSENEETVLSNDMDKARFDVWVDVGPSSSSKRAATVRALTGMAAITDDPETRSVLMSVAMMNIEGEGLGDVKDFFRAKMVRAGVIKPTDEEREQMAQEQANMPPDPQQQYLLAAAEEATANASQKRAQTVETIASADLKAAQRVKVLSDAMNAENAQQIASAQALRDMLQPPEPPSMPTVAP